MVHRPDHVRAAFLAAVEAFVTSQDGLQATVMHDGRRIPLSAAAGLVLHCTDVMPAAEHRRLINAGLDMKRRTYAACARAMRKALRTHDVSLMASAKAAQRPGEGYGADGSHGATRPGARFVPVR